VTPEHPSISVAIRSYEREPILFALLDRLRAQTVAPLEIVVIDSGSSPAVMERLRALSVSPEVVRDLPPPQSAANAPVVLIEIPNSEYQSARTLNQVLEASRGDLALILSQDALPSDERYLELMRQPFESDPRIAGAYSRQILGDSYCPLGEKDLARTYPERAGYQDPPNIRFVNTCSMIRRDVWRRIPFREEAIITEDHQWAKEAMEAGHRIFYQGLAAVHHFHYRDGVREIWKRFYLEGLGLARIHSRRLSLLMAAFQGAREIASDALWLTARGKPQYIGRSLAQRTAKHAGLYFGHRAARLDDKPMAQVLASSEAPEEAPEASAAESSPPPGPLSQGAK
jgi:rhamnosyltransferase